MRSVLALVAIPVLFSGCIGTGRGLSPVDSQPTLRGGEHVHRQPVLRGCSTPPTAHARSKAAAYTTIVMTVDAEGRVDPATIRAIGRVGYAVGPQTDSREALRRLKAKTNEIREWAERNASTCLFDPGATNGYAVEAPVRMRFWYADS